MLSESAIEKHVSAIFGKLGLSQEPHVHRRVAAVLEFLNDPGTEVPQVPGGGHSGGTA